MNINLDDFSNWKKWTNREKLENIKFPGIYYIAYSNENLEDKNFTWIKDIIYIGMTNSKGGLKNRLQQFENTISGKVGHGGAVRVLYKYSKYEELINKLYVGVKYFECDVNSNNSNDLLIMGKVAEFEFISFAKYVELFNELPEFNDKKRSPKK